MKIASLLLSLVAGITLAACGGESSGPDAATTTIDGAGTIDAGALPDASGTNTSTGLGQICTQQMACPAEAEQCLAFANGATMGMCSPTCGTSTAQDMPPADGNTICTAAYNGSSGTPLCFIATPPVDGTYNWFCGIACGDFQGNDLGTCPNGMTCTSNTCTP